MGRVASVEVAVEGRDLDNSLSIFVRSIVLFYLGSCYFIGRMKPMLFYDR